MTIGLFGKKLGMTQIFADDGTAVPVTFIKAETCQVSQIKTTDVDGYNAIQVGFGKGGVRSRPPRPELISLTKPVLSKDGKQVFCEPTYRSMETPSVRRSTECGNGTLRPQSDTPRKNSTTPSWP